MDNIKDEIKKKIDIIEFIGSYVNLKKAGRNFKGNCPFHQEKTPSFVVSPERQIWHCFGSCGEGGDAISFYMKWENISYLEAVKELAGKLGISVEGLKLDDPKSKIKERLLLANTYAAQFYSYMFHKNKYGQYAKEYIIKRGIREEMAKKFELGYAPSSWDSLYRYLVSKHFSSKELLDAGLVLKSEHGKLYDRFRGRLMFPIKDVKGNIIGFSGRILDGKDKTAKYINTPETLIYHKRESLYGFHFAKEAVKKEKHIILVEGEFDMISPYQHGIEHVAAIKGSAVTHEQLMLIKRFTNTITLALDTDEAGEEAIKRAIEEAEKLDFEVRVVTFDYAKDPDEAVRKDSAQFKKIIQKPIPIYDFIMSLYQKKYPEKDAFSKKYIGEGVAPFFTYIQNPIIESHYIKKLAQLLEVSEASVRTLLVKKKYRKRSSASTFIKPSKNLQNRDEVIQKHLLSLLLQHNHNKSLLQKVVRFISQEDFSYPAYRKLFSIIQTSDIFSTGHINTFADSLPTELKSLFDELYLYASSESETSERSIELLAYEIRERSLKRNMQSLLETESSPEVEKKLTQLNQEIKELEKKTSTI